ERAAPALAALPARRAPLPGRGGPGRAAPPPPMMRRLALPLALAALAALLVATAVPGIFIIDEDSYLVTVVGLRAGRLTIPGPEGLTPTTELVAFDAGPKGRVVERTPASSVSPPLYAPLALPFSYLGVRGLIALEALAFVVCAWLVHVASGRRPLALATFLVA